MDADFDLLKELTEENGVPGYEGRLRDLVRREFEDTTDEVRSDAMGNVVGTIEGESDYSVVVAAHMDEIGFMVKHITDDGFLQLDALGGWDPRVLKAQRVTVLTEQGSLPGVIGSVPPHTLTEEQKEKEPKVEDVHVDLGMPAEAVEEHVAVGDLVTTEQTTIEMGEFVTGKALDNRVSVFAMLEAARRLSNPAVTVHLVATVQEEVGLRGAEAVGVDLDPDLALALDTTVANDVPSFDASEYVTELGEGAGIKLKDSSVITNRKVHRRMREVAESEEIPYQLEVLPAGGTDTGGLQRSSGAKPAGAISVPTRYLHTPTESVHHADVDAAIDLLTAFLESETGEHDYTL
ncbi:endoglucanase [Halogranum gelatinilyticum]|uniref:Endoglucanase n=1 Tax=Halogranum gelatinilyticum TaxID=660521 RepID=A0A1G9QMR7_9EURY|nr:M42 family metallopeptidase [Halogranum gelatinilyticum]SDM12304.1 endoglucanase [Halogranum gelatinilyticum]